MLCPWSFQQALAILTQPLLQQHLVSKTSFWLDETPMSLHSMLADYCPCTSASKQRAAPLLYNHRLVRKRPYTCLPVCAVHLLCAATWCSSLNSLHPWCPPYSEWHTSSCCLERGLGFASRVALAECSVLLCLVLPTRLWSHEVMGRRVKPCHHAY